MRESSKPKRGGRYHRSEWTQYHTRLAQISEKEGEKERHEKVVKLTELLRKREIISERNQETMVESELHKNQMCDEESDTEMRNNMELVGNFCTEETNKKATNGDKMTSEIEATHVPDGTVPSTARTSQTDETGQTSTTLIRDKKIKVLTQRETSDTMGKSDSESDDTVTISEKATDSMIWENAAEATENTSETMSVPSPVKIKQESIQIAIKGNWTNQSETGRGVIDLVGDNTNSSSVDLSKISADAQESRPLQPDNDQVEHRRQQQTAKTNHTTTNYGRTKSQSQGTSLETAGKRNTIISITDTDSQIVKDNMIWEYAEKHSALMTQQESSFVNGTNLASRPIECQSSTNDSDNDEHRARYETKAHSGTSDAKNKLRAAADTRQEWDTPTNCLDTDIEFVESDDEIENTSSTYSTDKSTDESDDDMDIVDIMEELMPTTTWQSNVDEASPLSKRKSDTYANKNPKRAHLTQADQATDSPVQHNKSYASKETDHGLTNSPKSKQEYQNNTDNINDKNLSGTGTIFQSADESVSETNYSSNKQVNHKRSGSDTEWEDISRKIKTTPIEQRDGSERKMKSLVKPMDMKKRAQFRSVTRVITNTRGSTGSESVQERGLLMMDEREKLTTPVRIEYNIDASTGNFNIISSSINLFETMHRMDSSLRIVSSNSNTILWDSQHTLPEDDKFRESFQMREQHFRKGNSKINIYCVIESTLTVNRMKFTHPVKELLLDQNIWIKPDFYSTSVVSSP